MPALVEEESLADIITDKWMENPKPLTHSAGELGIILYDTVFDNLSLPLGSRCRCIVYPIEGFSFRCKLRLKPLISFSDKPAKRHILVPYISFNCSNL
jgi:hypothetical protein